MTDYHSHQVIGRKRVLLFSPAQSFRLYPHRVGHVMDNFTMVDVEKPDVARFPALAQARGVETVLEPGEVLWLPRFWWHFVQQRCPDAPNLSLNFWVGSKGTRSMLNELRNAPLEEPTGASGGPGGGPGSEADPESDPAFGDHASALRCLHASRMLEAAANKVCGGDPQKGGAFLTAMAAGDDASWQRDSQAAMYAAKLRSELAGWLGSSASVGALLRAMTRDGRLYPGLAQPIEGPVVNSEKGDVTPDKVLARLFEDFEAERGATG